MASASVERQCLMLKIPLFLGHRGAIKVDLTIGGARVTGEISWSGASSTADHCCNLKGLRHKLRRPTGPCVQSVVEDRHVVVRQQSSCQLEYYAIGGSEGDASLGTYDVSFCKGTTESDTTSPAPPGISQARAGAENVGSAGSQAPAPRRIESTTDRSIGRPCIPDSEVPAVLRRTTLAAPSNNCIAHTAPPLPSPPAAHASTSRVQAVRAHATVPTSSASSNGTSAAACILIDYSNILVGANERIREQQATHGSGSHFDARDLFDECFRPAQAIACIESLLGRADGPAAIGPRYLATGSSNISNSIADVFRVAGYTLFLPDHEVIRHNGRIIGRREHGVDSTLLQQGEQFLATGGPAYPRREIRQYRFVFVTGDGAYDEEADTSFPELAERALRKGWDIAVVSFKTSLSQEWNRLKARIEELTPAEATRWGRVSILFLEDVWHQMFVVEE